MFRNFAPLTEGWWHVYGHWIRDERVPYRDFELLVPPLYPYLIAVAQHFFGDNFFSLRIIGILLQAVIASLLWAVLRPIVSGLTLVASVTVGSVVLQSGTAFISYDYVYVALAFLLATFALHTLLAVGRHLSPLAWRVILVVSGVAAGLALTVKQTQGVAALLFGAISASWVASLRPAVEADESRGRKALSGCGLFGLGVAVILCATSIYLIVVGAGVDAFSQLAYSASETKGTLGHLVLAWTESFFRPEALSVLRLVVPIVSLAIFIRLIHQRFTSSTRDSMSTNKTYRAVTVNRIATITLSLSLFAVLLLNADLVVSTLQQIIFLPTIVVAVGVLVAVLGKRLPVPWITSSLASLAAVWACGMSAGLTEIGVFVGAAQLVSIWTVVAGSTATATIVAVALSLSVFSVSVQAKRERPYAWWGLTVPSSQEAQSLIDSGPAKGLLTDPATRQMLMEVDASLKSVKECPGEVIAFPAIPMLTFSSGEFPRGRLATYWFDFASPEGIDMELRRWRETRPKAILFLSTPESVYSGHERLFASGGKLGQREMRAYLYRLLGTPGWRKTHWSLPGGYALTFAVSTECSPDSIATA